MNKKNWQSIILFTAICLFSCTNDIVDNNKLKYPKIKKSSVKEIFCDKEIKDDYQNLENLQSDTIQKWFRDQNLFSEASLNKIDSRNTLFETIKDLNNRKKSTITDINNTLSGAYFYLQRDSTEVSPKVMYRLTLKNDPIVLFELPVSNTKKVINFIKPSWDEKHLAISITSGGAEVSDLFIYDCVHKKLLPEKITNCWPSEFGLSWLPDNTGFIYLHLPIVDNTNQDFLKNTQSVVYYLGDNPKKLNPIFSIQTHPELNLKPEDFPVVFLDNSDDMYFIGRVSGATQYSDHYYLPIQELEKQKKPIWKKLFSKDDLILFGAFRDNSFIHLSSKNTSNFSIRSFDVTSKGILAPETLVEEDSLELITNIKLVEDGFFYATSKNGVEAKLYFHETNNKINKEISLPKKSGSLSFFDTTNPKLCVGIRISGWTTDNERFIYNLKEKVFTDENLIEDSNYKEFTDFVVKEVEAISHDGTFVPLSIIHKKGIKLSGKNPTMIFGYGAYGRSMSPFFSPSYLSWVNEGGIWAIAHVRGGGEKGENWRLGGFQKNKSNSWKDLIACTEYLIKEGYTSNDHTTIFSASAGGVLIGRAITERPDLFSSALIRVGVLTTYKREFSPNGANNAKEYGSIHNPETCESLIEMDPYLNLERNVKYPAFMATAGMNDARVAPYIPGKFIARLQEYSISNNPILFRVDLDGGHGLGGNDPNKGHREFADLFSFALWRTGHPDYQPVQ